MSARLENKGKTKMMSQIRRDKERKKVVQMEKDKEIEDILCGLIYSVVKFSMLMKTDIPLQAFVPGHFKWMKEILFFSSEKHTERAETLNMVPVMRRSPYNIFLISP